MAETPYQRDMRRMADSMEAQARLAQRAANREMDRQNIEMAVDAFYWLKRRRARKAAAAAQPQAAQQAAPAPAAPAAATPQTPTVAQTPPMTTQHTGPTIEQPGFEPGSQSIPPLGNAVPPTSPYAPAAPAAPDTRAWTVLGIAGFALAIIALWLPVMGMNTAVSIGAGVLGYLGVKETRDGALRGRGYAIAAIVLAGFGLFAQAIHFLAVLLDLIVRFLPGH